MKDTGQRIQTEAGDDKIAIKVEHVSKTFRLPHNRQNSLKGSLINLLKGGDHTYEKQEVLKDISFEIKKGEFFGIVGRNGSGKSTLLKMLAGIYKPTEGNITVNGSLTPFIELGVGFNPELTGRENVYLNGALLGFDNRDVDTMYGDIVAFAELERFMDQKLKNYSSGMQVRLAFSIAIRAKSDILLLDEVLAVGDAAFQKKCFDYFRELKKNKRTVVFISHDMNAVREYCDRVVLVDGGELKESGDADTIALEYTKLFMNKGHTKTTNGERWGTGSAEIKKVSVSGEDDSDITILTSVAFKAEAKEPIVGFYINSPLGTKIVENNTKWARVLTGNFHKGDRVEVKWILPNIFTNGENTVTIAVSDRDGSEYYDWYENAATFIIDKDAVTTAVTLPGDKITIKRQ